VAILKGEAYCEGKSEKAEGLPVAISEAEPIPVEDWEEG